MPLRYASLGINLKLRRMVASDHVARSVARYYTRQNFYKRPYVDESGWVLAVPLAIDFAGEVTGRRISNAAMAAAPAAVVARSLTWQLPTS